MKRSIADVLRRGFDNTVANWPLLLLRLGEAVVGIALMLGGLVAMLMPLLVSLGLGSLREQSPEVVLSTIFSGLAGKGLMLLWIFLGATVLLLVLILVHSFVEAGSVRVYIDGDAQAGPANSGLRSRFAAFSMERWWEGARAEGLTVFWIYNVVWGIAGLIILVPALPFVGVMIAAALSHNEAGLACGGCLALLVILLTAIVVGLVAGAWCEKAIVTAVRRGGGVRDALSIAKWEVRADVARHVLTVLILIVVSMVISGIFSGASGMFGMMEGLSRGRGDATTPLALSFAFLPLRLAITFLNTAVSTFIGGWMAASFAALTPESR